jgi:hypothetical protein
MNARNKKYTNLNISNQFNAKIKLKSINLNQTRKNKIPVDISKSG